MVGMRLAGIHRLLLGGALDVALSALLAVLCVLLTLPFDQPLAIVVDLAACLAAALTVRWPRAAGAALGLVLLLYSKHRDAFPALWPMAIFITTIAVVAGWIAVEIWVFSRLRIGVYDTEYVAPTTEDGDQ